MRDDLVGVPLLGNSFTGHLPVLEEITSENLQYDVRDAQQVSSYHLCKSIPLVHLAHMLDCGIHLQSRLRQSGIHFLRVPSLRQWPCM